MKAKLFAAIGVALALFAFAAFWGCEDGDSISLGMELVTPSNPDNKAELDPFEGVIKLVVTVQDADDESKKATATYTPENGFGTFNVTLKGLDQYLAFRVMVEGKDADDKVVSRGITPEMDTASLEGKTFAVYFAPAGALSLSPEKLSHARFGLKLSLPNDNDVLVIGGVERTEGVTITSAPELVERFSPVYHKVTPLMDAEGENVVKLTNGLWGHEVLALDLAQVLVIGGYGTNGENPVWQDRPLALDGSVDSRLNYVTLNETEFVPRESPALNWITSAKVLICGGRDEKDQSRSDCYKLDASSLALSTSLTLKTPRFGHTQTPVFRDVYTYGTLFYGGNADQEKVAEWLPNEGDMTRVLDTAPKEIRSGHRAASMAYGKALIVGGRVNGKASRSGVLVDGQCVSSGCVVFTELPELLQSARADFTLTPLSETALLACGGFDEEENLVGDCEILQMNGEFVPVFVRAMPMQRARALHDALRLPGGIVLLAGGVGIGAATEESTPAPMIPLDSIEIYMPKE